MRIIHSFIDPVLKKTNFYWDSLVFCFAFFSLQFHSKSNGIKSTRRVWQTSVIVHWIISPLLKFSCSCLKQRMEEKLHVTHLNPVLFWGFKSAASVWVCMRVCPCLLSRMFNSCVIKNSLFPGQILWRIQNCSRAV